MILKNTILFFLLIGFAFNVNGQKPSLSEQAKAMSDSSFSYSKLHDYDNALKYVDSAIYLAELSDNKSIKAKYLNKKAIIYYKLSDYQQALHYFNTAIKNTDDSLFIAQCYSNIGSAYVNLGNNNIASDYYFRALKINENNNFEEGIADVYLNMSNVYMSMEEFDSALDFQFKALEYYLDNDNKTEAGYCLSNIGLAYLDLNKVDTAIHYLYRALEFNIQTNDQHGIAGGLINIAHANIKKGYYNKAIASVEKAKAICITSKDTYFLTKCLLTEATIYKELGNTQKAIALAKEALQIANRIGVLGVAESADLALSKLYESSKEYDNALIYYKSYNTLKDSSLAIDKTKAIQNLKIQYETEKKEQQIISLEEEKKQSEKMKLFLIITSIALLVTIIISIYSFFLKIKNSKAKLQLSKAIRQKQELELIKKDLENENLEKDLELKHKELTTNAMNLIRNIEINSNLFRELNTLLQSADEQQKNKIEEIISSYKIMSKDKGWKEFELRFGQVHKSFYQNLSAKFPDLSPNEKKICAFLRLNMTTKDIALITYKNVNTINQARKRLRKKMDIATDVNLITFLSKL